MIGQMFYYKRTGGRGRPFVGTVTKNLGALVEVQNKNTGEVVKIQKKYLGNTYEFKPYKKTA